MVDANFSALKQTKLHEYLMRFLFGGLATVLAGVIAAKFGPAIGGLFLAFPAIFPATATLIESHEKKRMAKIGHDGSNRGRMAASLDAAGAAMGCIGLAGFAVVLWYGLPNHNALVVIAAASAVWVLLAIASWELRRKPVFANRMRLLILRKTHRLARPRN